MEVDTMSETCLLVTFERVGFVDTITDDEVLGVIYVEAIELFAWGNGLLLEFATGVLVELTGTGLELAVGILLVLSAAGVDDELITVEDELNGVDDELIGVDDELIGVNDELIGVDVELIFVDDEIIGMDVDGEVEVELEMELVFTARYTLCFETL